MSRPVNRIGIHADFGEIAHRSVSMNPGARRRMNACLTDSEHNARPTTSHRPRFRRAGFECIPKQIDLHAGVGAILEIVSLASAMHRAIVAGLGHESQNLRIHIVGKHAVEFQMEEWFFNRLRSINRRHR